MRIQKLEKESEVYLNVCDDNGVISGVISGVIKNENVEDSNFMMLHHYKAIINLWEISLVFQAHWNFEF